MGLAVKTQSRATDIGIGIGLAVLLTLLGETFDGVVSSDRYKAYLRIPLERRQVCWAHLKRNLIAFAERSGEIGD